MKRTGEADMNYLQIENALKQGRVLVNKKGVYLWCNGMDEVIVEVGGVTVRGNSWEIYDDGAFTIFSKVGGDKKMVTAIRDIADFEIEEEFARKVFAVMKNGRATGERMFILRKDEGPEDDIYDVFFFSVFPDSYVPYLARIAGSQLVKRYYHDRSITVLDNDLALKQLSMFMRGNVPETE